MKYLTIHITYFIVGKKCFSIAYINTSNYFAIIFHHFHRGLHNLNFKCFISMHFKLTLYVSLIFENNWWISYNLLSYNEFRIMRVNFAKKYSKMQILKNLVNFSIFSFSLNYEIRFLYKSYESIKIIYFHCINVGIFAL